MRRTCRYFLAIMSVAAAGQVPPAGLLTGVNHPAVLLVLEAKGKLLGRKLRERYQ
ncbi:MAG: hypothetical protein ABIR79_13355 [Candidatus Binatia bacterium]